MSDILITDGRIEMEVVILFGSPRKEGNTMHLVSAFASVLKERQHHVRTLYLNDMNIRPCQGCMTCLATGTCRINDDMKDIRKYIVESDCIVLATPIYWFTVSGQLKLAMDRSLPFMDETYVSRIKGKRVYTLMTCGSEDEGVCSPALGTFAKTFELLGLVWTGHVEALGCPDRGPVKETYLEQVRMMASSL